MSIRKLRSLVETTNLGGSLSTISVLDRRDEKPRSNVLNRIGGNPVGVSDEAWPTFFGRAMEHVMSLDLQSTPNLRRGPLAEIRCIAVFISDAIDNEAFAPLTPETKVVLLSDREIDNGESVFYDSGTIESCAFDVSQVDVPKEIFEDVDSGNDDLMNLRREILGLPAWCGEVPLWLQYKEHDGYFVLQFDERFIDINLGDGGVMYIFSDTAFWQCH